MSDHLPNPPRPAQPGLETDPAVIAARKAKLLEALSRRPVSSYRERDRIERGIPVQPGAVRSFVHRF